MQAHADTAMVNLNIWLAPDSANLGSPETDDGGGLTVFHAKPPGEREISVLAIISNVKLSFTPLEYMRSAFGKKREGLVLHAGRIADKLKPRREQYFAL